MDVNVEIKRQLGVISTKKNGWSKELNVVAWNNQPAKYDVRDWDETHERMSRGITLTEEEAKGLYELLKGEFGDA